jgi:hypothetical protein
MAEYQKVNEFLLRLKEFGISWMDFRRTQEHLDHKWGTETTPENAYWVILNQLTNKFTDEPYIAAKLFFQMGEYLFVTGKNPRIAISEGQRWFLRGLLEDGVTSVKIKTAADHQVCRGCSSLNNVEIGTEEAIAQLPVPSNCTSAYCRCSYTDRRGIYRCSPSKDW